MRRELASLARLLQRGEARKMLYKRTTQLGASVQSQDHFGRPNAEIKSADLCLCMNYRQRKLEGNPTPAGRVLHVQCHQSH